MSGPTAARPGSTPGARGPGRGAATAVLCAAFALSGAAALVFEALFFRLAGLALGNGVWAVSLVLCSFMFGLAVGNAWAGRFGDRLRAPLRLYALLELAIAVSGVTFVLLLPWLPGRLAPLLGGLQDTPLFLNLARLATAFGLMLAPAAAMGMTLPVVVRALAARDPELGHSLGRLYGWNTLGAVAGVLVAERVLVERFGMSGAALVAAGANALAAALAFALHATSRAAPETSGTAGVPPTSGRSSTSDAAVPRAADARPARARLLAAAFLIGAILLALEVVWFRFFLLFALPHAWNLAVMLAVVLAGIGLGGLAASVAYRRGAAVHRLLPALCLLNGALVAVLYRLVAAGVGMDPDRPLELLYVTLAFPVSFVSGAMFPMLGRALFSAGAAESAATGRAATANTLGSALGSLLGGFALIPVLGMERSFFALALAYGLVALVLLVPGPGRRALPDPGRSAWVPAALLLLALASFPFGAMERSILTGPRSARAMIASEDMELVGVREGLTETIQYYRKDLCGEPYYFRLITNSYPMSATRVNARRYMKLYVYWPAAVNPGMKKALLISYGVGMTAKALTDTRRLESIDVVDISRDVLDMNRLVYPDPAELPLNDPRVHVHVEDGRFFLQVTDETFDLITAEPPPPRLAGVVNLYSREYFELIDRRLAGGGVVTYWLPVSQLALGEAKAILRAFLDVFPEASLWSGAGLEWMMVGVKGHERPTSGEAFARQWEDPVVAPELRAVGLLEPEQLGALYIADAERLAEWVGDTPPLVDDYPQRIASHDVVPDPEDALEFFRFMSGRESEESFRRSRQIERILPWSMKQGALGWFAAEDVVDVLFTSAARYEVLHAALADPRLAPYVPIALYSDDYAQRIVARFDGREPGELIAEITDADVLRHLAARALAERRFTDTERLLRAAGERSAAGQETRVVREGFVRVYLLLAAGERGAALRTLREVARAAAERPAAEGMPAEARTFWDWARGVFPDLPDWDQATG